MTIRKEVKSVEFNKSELETLTQWYSMIEKYYFLNDKDNELKEKILNELKHVIK